MLLAAWQVASMYPYEGARLFELWLQMMPCVWPVLSLATGQT
jgi:hypothetical protein